MKQHIITTLLILTTLSCAGVASAYTMYVPDDYATIQSAVANANPGDIIIVRDGTYNENIDVDKRLTIKSENGAANCVVNASDPHDHVFEILADSVVINGFTVQNATGYGMGNWRHAGIQITKSSQVTISDCVTTNNVFGIRTYISYYTELTRNTAKDNMYGIYLASSPHTTLTENALWDNSVRNLDISGMNTDAYWHKHNIDTTNTVNGKPVYYYTDTNNLLLENRDAGHITLVDCTGATIRGCDMNGCDELRLIATNDSRVEENTVCNTDYAIRLLYSNNNLILNNIANDNTNGIRVQHGNNNRVAGNTLERDRQGVFVEGCENTTVAANTIEDSTDTGCWIYDNNYVMDNMIKGSSRYGLCINGHDNTITRNTIIDSENTQWSGGISLTGYSKDNLVYNNYFDNPNNNRDIGTNNVWNRTITAGPNIIGGPSISGNYWSDYTGTDDNNDGFGDTPYHINSLAHDYNPLVHTQATCGDVVPDGNINILDLTELLNIVVAGDTIDPCIGDTDGNRDINILDVRRLIMHINDPDGSPLNCGC